MISNYYFLKVVLPDEYLNTRGVEPTLFSSIFISTQVFHVGKKVDLEYQVASKERTWK